MNRYELSRIAEATVALNVGKLPPSGERPQIVKLPQRQVRVLSAAFYVRGRIPEIGDVIIIDTLEAGDLIKRGLAVLV